MRFFTLIYFFLALALYVLALPLIVFSAFKRKYRESIPARFFLWNNPPFKEERVWLHVCSLGEARALRPVLERLDEPVNITVTTQTGHAEAVKYDAQVRYLPYEIFMPFWTTPQRTLVVLEAEFWYLLFAAAKARGAKVVLLNARLSDRSFPKYLKMRWFYRRLLAVCDHVFVQSAVDKARFEQLGAPNVEVVGNIKLAQRIEATRHYEKPEGQTIVAASTHEGEEEAIFDAFVAYRAANPCRLVVVPRHPERFGSVWKRIEALAAEQGMGCSRWSETKTFHADIVLIDAMGELNNVYAISDIAVLGGAFEPIGGHNPLEPAAFGCKIITGTHFFHQKELFKYVHHVQFTDKEGIAAALETAAELPPSTVDESIDLARVVDAIKERK